MALSKQYAYRIRVYFAGTFVEQTQSRRKIYRWVRDLQDNQSINMYYDINTVDSDMYVEFDREQDQTFFLLKWSNTIYRWEQI